MQLRTWQKRALDRFTNTTSDMLVEASVGAGKTTFAAAASRAALDGGDCSFVLVVVPTKAIKDAFQEKFAQLGVELTTLLKEGRGRPKQYQAGACTYAQLPNLVSTVEKWGRNGEKILLVFDEIHHCASGEHANEWGASVEGVRRSAVRSVSLSGTPFRVDGRRISFVRYDGEEKANPDIRYTYAQAVSDNVCRHVTFLHDDGVASYSLGGHTVEHRISKVPKDEKGRACGAVFQPRTEFLESLIAKCDEKLESIRAVDPDAGCLVICRPGRDHSQDDAHVEKIAEEIFRITGDDPVVVTHRDNGAGDKIKAFARGRDKYIVAVRMISEGIDIPRLRIVTMANATESEMLFRQMVGRAVRQEGHEPEEAYVYFAKFPPMSDFAERIREEADAGLRDKEKKKRDGGVGGGEAQGYTPLGATHEDGGATSYTDRFTADEVAEAEAIRLSDPALRNTPIHLILHARKAKPEPTHPKATEPRQVRIKGKRKKLSQRLRKLGAMSGEKDAFGKIAGRLFREVGAKNMDDLCDNHSEEKVDAAITVAGRWIAEHKNAG